MQVSFGRVSYTTQEDNEYHQKREEMRAHMEMSHKIVQLTKDIHRLSALVDHEEHHRQRLAHDHEKEVDTIMSFASAHIAKADLQIRQIRSHETHLLKDFEMYKERTMREEEECGQLWRSKLNEVTSELEAIRASSLQQSQVFSSRMKQSHAEISQLELKMAEEAQELQHGCLASLEDLGSGICIRDSEIQELKENTLHEMEELQLQGQSELTEERLHCLHEVEAFTHEVSSELAAERCIAQGKINEILNEEHSADSQRRVEWQALVDSQERAEYDLACQKQKCTESEIEFQKEMAAFSIELQDQRCITASLRIENQELHNYIDEHRAQQIPIIRDAVPKAKAALRRAATMSPRRSKPQADLSKSLHRSAAMHSIQPQNANKHSKASCAKMDLQVDRAREVRLNDRPMLSEAVQATLQRNMDERPSPIGGKLQQLRVELANLHQKRHESIQRTASQRTASLTQFQERVHRLYANESELALTLYSLHHSSETAEKAAHGSNLMCQQMEEGMRAPFLNSPEPAASQGVHGKSVSVQTWRANEQLVASRCVLASNDLSLSERQAKGRDRHTGQTWLDERAALRSKLQRLEPKPRGQNGQLDHGKCVAQS